MNSGNRKQRWDCKVVFVNSSVGENDDVCTVVISLVNLDKQPVYSLCKSCVFIIENRNNGYLEAGDFHILDFEYIG